MLGVMPIRNFSGGVPFTSKVGWFQIFDQYLSELILILEDKTFTYRGEVISFDTNKDISDFLTSVGEIREQDDSVRELYNIIEKGFQSYAAFNFDNISEIPLEIYEQEIERAKSNEKAEQKMKQNIFQIVKSKVELYNKIQREKNISKIMPLKDSKRQLDSKIAEIFKLDDFGDVKYDEKVFNNYFASLIKEYSFYHNHQPLFEEFADILEFDTSENLLEVTKFIEKQRKRLRSDKRIYVVYNMEELVKYYERLKEFAKNYLVGKAKYPSQIKQLLYPSYLMEETSMNKIVNDYKNSLLDNSLFVNGKLSGKYKSMFDPFSDQVEKVILNIRQGIKQKEINITNVKDFISNNLELSRFRKDTNTQNKLLNILEYIKRSSTNIRDQDEKGIPISRKAVFEFLEIYKLQDRQLLLSSTLKPMAMKYSERSSLYELKMRLPEDSTYNNLNIKSISDNKIAEYKEILFQEISETREKTDEKLENVYKELIESLKKEKIPEGQTELVYGSSADVMRLLPSYSDDKFVQELFLTDELTYRVPLTLEAYTKKNKEFSESIIDEKEDLSFNIYVEGFGNVNPYKILMRLGIKTNKEDENTNKTTLYFAI